MRELREELGIEADEDDLRFVGIHRGAFKKEFYGRVFQDFEISQVYVYDRWVDETSLNLQAEEVEHVMWVDLDECVRCVSDQTIPTCIYLDELKMLEDFLDRTSIHRKILGI